MSLSLLCVLAFASGNDPVVTLVAVTDTSKKLSWTPAGKLLPKTVLPNRIMGAGLVNSSPMLVFDIRSDEQPSISYFLAGRPTHALGNSVLLERGSHWRALVTLPPPTALVIPVLEFGVAGGKWSTIGSFSNRSKKKTGKPFYEKVVQSDSPSEKASGSRWAIAIHVKLPLSNDAVRVVAFGKGGRPMTSSGSIFYDRSRTGEFWFHGKVADFAKVELQSRPYTIQQAKNVHLQPNVPIAHFRP